MKYVYGLVIILCLLFWYSIFKGYASPMEIRFGLFVMVAFGLVCYIVSLPDREWSEEPRDSLD